MANPDMSYLFTLISSLLSDEQLKKTIFRIPDTDKKLIENMDNLFNIKTDSNTDVSGIIIKSKNSIILNKCIIYSHGTGNDIYNIYEHIQSFSDEYGVNVICYDYPGFGLTTSNNNIDENGCYECHEAIVKYATNELNIDKNDLILIGQSLGTGVVVDYISKEKNEWNNLVILLSPYKSIPRIVLDSNMIDNLTKYQFNSFTKIDKAKCPIKIFHGKLDDFILPYHSKDLFEKISDKSHNVEIVDDAGHTDLLFKIDKNIIRSLLSSSTSSTTSTISTNDEHDEHDEHDE